MSTHALARLRKDSSQVVTFDLSDFTYTIRSGVVGSGDGVIESGFLFLTIGGLPKFLRADRQGQTATICSLQRDQTRTS